VRPVALSGEFWSRVPLIWQSRRSQAAAMRQEGDMTVAFELPPCSLVDRSFERLRGAVDRFVDLDAFPPAPQKLYHEVLAAVHEICAAIVDLEEQGVERGEILEVMEPVRAIHARSPFVNRLQTWPRGYPGDFETVEYICDAVNRAPFGTIEYFCEQYALTRGIAQQHRNKVQLQAARILRTIGRKPRASKIFSIACGSCPDLRSIQQIGALAGEVWLNDADREALAFAESKLEEIRDRIHLVPGNAIQVARSLNQRFDLVLAGGLFDYLPERFAVLLIRLVLSRLLAPGGTFLFTNIAAGNPYRPLIEYFGDWVLTERTDADMLRYCIEAGARPEQVTITRESTGLALIIEVKG
jgi:ubiquinone/menaquinone biosynthesis C-methylase UbiE